METPRASYYLTRKRRRCRQSIRIEALENGAMSEFRKVMYENDGLPIQVVCSLDSCTGSILF